MEDNKVRINWYDILSKIIFLIIIILVLMWFFPRNNNVNNNEDINTKLDNISTNISVLVDKIFKDNLNEMKNAARTYFTKDRMPSEDGDSVKMSLQEMYDNNMLLPLIDKNNKACNADESYVKVTKDGNKYSLKISLTCGDETKSITDTIGCYDYCEDGSCTKKLSYNGTLQYQFMREVKSTKYSCPKGYTLKGKYCYTEKFGERINAEEIWEDEKTVTKDPIDKGDKVYEDATKVVDESTYTCPSGYTLDGKVCKKVETTPATPGYVNTCPSGYTLNGNYCIKTTTVNATANYKYKCNSGYTLNGTKCSKQVTTQVKTGTECTAYKYTDWKYVKSYSTTTYTAQYTKTTTKLDYVGSYQAYPCNGGNYSRSCPRKVTYYKYKYYTREKKCSASKDVYENKTTTQTVDATKYVDSYSCPSGYTKNGSICTKSETTPAKQVESDYSCPTGYTLSGKTCNKTVSIDATEIPGKVSYTCPEGKTLEGNKCWYKATKLTCEDEDAKLVDNKCVVTIPAKIVGYKCPNGYKKDGKTCYNKVTVKEKANSKTVIKYQYTWSSLKSLKGWTRTGKTRTV